MGTVESSSWVFPFRRNCANKRAGLELGQKSWGSDTAGHENTAARKGFERQVAGLGPVEVNKHLKRLDADGTGTIEAQPGDFRRRISSRLIRNWDDGRSCIQEFMQRKKAPSGDD